MYGLTPAADFGPLALKAVRREMIRMKWCRNYINRHISRIKHVFKWATENQLLAPGVYHGLMAVAGLQAGRSEARETEAVKPVAEADMRAVLPFLSPQVRAMVELEALCGARPGELCIMRTCDIDRTRKVRVYRPAKHKTAHHDAREIRIGPAAQAILTPFLKPNLAAYIFSPADAEEARHEQRRADRKTPLTPSQQRRAERAARRQRKRPPLDYYTPTSYRRAVRLLTIMRRAGEVPFHWIADNSRWQRKPRTAENKVRRVRLRVLPRPMKRQFRNADQSAEPRSATMDRACWASPCSTLPPGGGKIDLKDNVLIIDAAARTANEVVYNGLQGQVQRGGVIAATSVENASLSFILLLPLRHRALSQLAA